MKYLYENQNIPKELETCIKDNSALHAYFEMRFDGIRPKSYCGFLSIEGKSYFIIPKNLNEKITETLGEDYVLGHSYFMKIESDDDLGFVMKYKIEPLLEEYFYGDIEGLKSVVETITS